MKKYKTNGLKGLIFVLVLLSATLFSMTAFADYNMGTCCECHTYDEICEYCDSCYNCVASEQYHCSDCDACYWDYNAADYFCDMCGRCSDCVTYCTYCNGCGECLAELGLHCDNCYECYRSVDTCRVCGVCVDCRGVNVCNTCYTCNDCCDCYVQRMDVEIDDNGYPVISWGRLMYDDVAAYHIYRSTVNSFSDSEIIASVAPEADSCTDTTAEAETTYYYWLRAELENGYLTAANGSVKAVTPHPAIRFRAIGVTVTTGYPYIVWEHVPEVEKYYLYRSTTGEEGSYVLVNNEHTKYMNLYDDDDVEPGVTYYYKICAEYSDGTMTPFSVQIALTAKKRIPTLAVEIDEKTGCPKLTWDEIDVAEGYNVYRYTEENGLECISEGLKSTSYIDTTAQAGTTYYYRVKMVYDNGGEYKEGIESNEVEAALTKRLSAPVVTATNIASTGKIQLKWNAVEGAREYQIYRSTSKDGRYKLLKTTTGTSLKNTSVNAGETYWYKVKAVHSNSSATSAYSTAVGRTVDLPQPVVTATNIASTGKIQLKWDAVDGAKEYKVYRSTTKDGEYKLLKTTTGTSLKNTSVNAGETYYYKVKAIHTNSSANSAYSTSVGRTVDLPQPKLTATNVASTGRVKLSWDAVEGAKEYKVYRSTTKDGEYKLLKTTTATSLKNTSVNAGETYYYKVMAVHATSAANSAYSTAVGRTVDLPQPVASVALNSKGKPRLTWNAVSGAKEYEVYRATSSSGTYTKLYTTTGTSMTNSSATAGKTYYYKVKAIHTNSSANSTYSAVKSIKSK